jgi:tRNA threonylcarbamoyladenosine biosynthesis protein TsaB
MLILGVDTSGKHGSIALVRFDSATATLQPKAFNREGREEQPQSSQRTTSHTLEVAPLEGGTFSAQLVPQISGLLQKHGLTKHQIDAFAVVSGPGSFTGLRVGLAAIKALADILQKPIAAVSQLEVIASAVILAGTDLPAIGSGSKCLVVMDAGRKETFVAEYEIGDLVPRLLGEHLLTYGELAQRAEDLGKGMLILTPDETLIQLTTSYMKDPFLANFVHVPRPNAATIAPLAWKKIQAGHTVTPEALDASYIRRSEAEIRLYTSRG